MAFQEYSYKPRTLDIKTVEGSDPSTTQETIRLAVVGAGSMGAEHIETAYAVGRASVVGLYDPYPPCIEYAKAFIPESDRKDVRVYASLNEAGEDENVDAIIIASPNYLHMDNVRELLPYNKHILCEKPMTTTLEDALEMLSLTGGYEKVFHVGFEYREKLVFAEAKYQLSIRNEIGDIKMMYIQEHRSPFLNKWQQWNKFAKQSGGTLVEKGCHYFDLFNWYAQSRPIKVYASGGMGNNFKTFEFGGVKSDIIDNAFVVIDYENGIRACLNLNMFVSKPEVSECMSINGTRGTIYLKADPLNEVYVGINGDVPTRRYRLESPSRIARTGTHAGSTYYEHVRFYDAIQGIEKIPVGSREGMWAVAMGVAAERSARSGMPVLMKDLFGGSLPDSL